MSESLILRRVTDAAVPAAIQRVRSPTESVSAPASARVPATEAMLEKRDHDPIQAPSLVSSSAMSFNINPKNNSITVTLSDRTSGEILRKLVYDFGAPQRQTARLSGQLIDVAT